MDTFSITSTVKTYPKLPYEEMKNTVLGKKFDLSLVFVGEKRAKRLNEEHRNKDYIPNVLSFPLTENSGEIFICPKAAAKEAADFDLSLEGYIGFLFIHGMLHLRGLDHGDEMDRLEQKYLTKFKLS